MGSSSGGGNKKKSHLNARNRQRANMSFFIVVMFFAVFGIIIFTEIFLIDEHGRGVLVRHGSLTYQQQRHHERLGDYDDILQNDDYLSIRMGAALAHVDDTVGALLVGRKPVIRHDDDTRTYSETVLPPYPLELAPPTDGRWQYVNGTRYKFLVYSAFYDGRRGQHAIRVIGSTKTRGPERVWCRLWYNRTSNTHDTNATVHYLSKTVQAKIKVIRENWNLKYSACFIMCPLIIAPSINGANNQTLPMAVSIVARITQSPTNLIRVMMDNSRRVVSSKKMAACIKPLHFHYNRAIQILEFIELNRIMGVEHFFFYNHTVGKHVNCLLKNYIDGGIITLLPWQLDMISQKEIRTEGLFAALNDCLYRSMYQYSHILLVDLDEFIIPKYNDTLIQLIDYLNNRTVTSRTATAAYSFQNAFFYLQWSDDPSAAINQIDPIDGGLVTLRKTRRRSKLHPHKQRSKYICRPEFVIEAGNHFVWEFVPGHGTMSVPPESAILHHYRICEFGGDDCIKTASIIDTTAFRYVNKLTDAVRKQYQQLNDKCHLNELYTPSVRVFDKLLGILKT